MVPAEGIEPPTFGLQNRCTTAVLSRPRLGIDMFHPSEGYTVDALSAPAIVPAASVSLRRWPPSGQDGRVADLGPCRSPRPAEARHLAAAEPAFDIPEAELARGFDDAEGELHHLLATGKHNLRGKLHDGVGRRRSRCLLAVVARIPVGNFHRTRPGAWTWRVGIGRRRGRAILIERDPAVGIGAGARHKPPGPAFGIIGLVRRGVGRRIGSRIRRRVWRRIGRRRRIILGESGSAGDQHRRHG